MCATQVISRGSSPVRAVDRIVDCARSEWGVPVSVAEYARAATIRRFAGEERSGGFVPDARLEAYFWGVVRRMAFRGGQETGDLRRRFIEASLAC
jgi:hypothetical protein